jgi:hypothetical protein
VSPLGRNGNEVSLLDGKFKMPPMIKFKDDVFAALEGAGLIHMDARMYNELHYYAMEENSLSMKPDRRYLFSSSNFINNYYYEYRQFFKYL